MGLSNFRDAWLLFRRDIRISEEPPPFRVRPFRVRPRSDSRVAISRVRDRRNTRADGTYIGCALDAHSRNLDITEFLSLSLGFFSGTGSDHNGANSPDASHRIFVDSKSCSRPQSSAVGIPPRNIVTRIRIILRRLYAIRCDNRVPSIDEDRESRIAESQSCAVSLRGPIQ